MKRNYFKIKNNQKRIRLGARSLLFLLGLFLFMQVLFSVQQGTFGAEFSDLEAQSNELLDENRKLGDDLVRSTSLLSLNEKVEALGYSKSSATLYIKIGESFAQVLR